MSGGGGGGAILIASDTFVTNNGSVTARGGSVGAGCSAGPGSGGAIRMVAPYIAGFGIVDVSGGINTFSSSNYGGDGRARFDCRSISNYMQIRGTRAVWSVGRNPLIYIPNSPRLDIIQAAGTTIPEGTNGAVFIILPPASPTNQIITLQARNLPQTFQTWIDITPESGPSSRTNFVWQTTTNPAITNITVIIGNSTPTRIAAWADYNFQFNEH